LFDMVSQGLRMKKWSKQGAMFPLNVEVMT